MKSNVPDREVDILGLKVKVVPDAGLAKRMRRERGTLVCVRAGEQTPFSDNVLGSCIACERGVQHRPYMPLDVAKVCTQCIAALPEGVLQAKVDAFYVSRPRSRADMRREKRAARNARAPG